MEETNASRELILDTAEAIFAQKGFDGARVDEIAKQAGVNKALIYYYFKSKRGLLNELTKRFLEQWVAQLTHYSKEYAEHFSSKEKFKKMMTSLQENILQGMLDYIDLFHNQKNILKIIMLESLKESDNEPFIYRVADLLINDEVQKIIEYMESQGIVTDTDKTQLIVTEFFTSTIPFILFVIFGESFARYLHIDTRELKARYIKAFFATHGAYHKKLNEDLTE